MFIYPASSHVDRVIPKTRFLENSTASPRIKKLLTEEILQLRWQAKLGPTTINLPASNSVQEIQIFHISLKSESIHTELLDWIDKTIPHPIIFTLTNSCQATAMSAAHKRPSEADSALCVISERFNTAFTCPDKTSNQPLPLPTSVNLESLYHSLIASILPLTRRQRESISDLISRCHQHNQLQRQADQLQSKIRREKQFNRKMIMNQELSSLNLRLKHLST